MRLYERTSTLLTSTGPSTTGGTLPGDTAAITALDRLLHHAHVLKVWPTQLADKVQADLRPEERTQ